MVSQLKEAFEMAQFYDQLGFRLSTNQAEIYYECLGDPKKDSVVLLHGGMADMTSFNALIPYLADYYVIAIDSRGHGRSTLGGEPLSYRQLQLDVQDVIEALNLKNCTIIGHSDGGIVALRLAAARLASIKQIITIGAGWRLMDDDPVKDIYESITAQGWLDKFPQAEQSYRAINPQPDFTRLVNEVRAMWLDVSSNGYPNEAIAQIECPVLVCRGDDDFLVSLSHTQEIVDRVQSAALFNVPYATHVVHEERPEWLALVFKDFIDRQI